MLASGLKSHYYFDLRRLNGDAQGIHTVAKIFHNMIKKMDGVNSVGGLESGSISIATAISQLSHIENPTRPLTSFYVRKNPKKYGTKNQIEGVLRSPAVVVDDVITSGASAILAADTIRGAGCECRAILSIIFRGGNKDKENIRQNSEFHHIFRESDFIDI